MGFLCHCEESEAVLTKQASFTGYKKIGLSRPSPRCRLLSSRAQPRHDSAGFTLIEALVSLALLSVFLSALFFTQLQSVKIARAAEKNILKAQEAQNHSEKQYAAGLYTV